jgi:hypothetical protein
VEFGRYLFSSVCATFHDITFQSLPTEPRVLSLLQSLARLFNEQGEAASCQTPYQMYVDLC